LFTTYSDCMNSQVNYL